LLLSIGAAFSVEGARMFRVRSLPGTLLSTIVLLCIAAFAIDSALARMHRCCAFVAVLVVSKLEGLVNGSLPPQSRADFGFLVLSSGCSMSIRSSSDRLALRCFS